jgi:hypothetical protein
MLFVIFYFLFAGYIINSIYIGGGLAIILQIFASIGVASFFLKEKFSSKYFIFYLLLFSIFIFYHVFFLKIDANNIFEKNSRNGISTLGLVYSIQYYFIAVKNQEPIRLWPSVLCLFLSIIGIGRTGIAVSTGLFLYILLFKAKHSSWYKLLCFCLIIFFSLFIFLYKDLIIEIIELYKTIKSVDIGSKGDLLSSGGRVDLWKEYIVNLKWYEWVIGKNLEIYHEKEFMFRKGNLHNSFFLMHARYGFAVIVYIFFVLLIILKHKKEHEKKIYAALLFLILFRGIFDQLFFFSPIDFVVMSLFFSLLIERRCKHVSVSENMVFHQSEIICRKYRFVKN